MVYYYSTHYYYHDTTPLYPTPPPFASAFLWLTLSLSQSRARLAGHIQSSVDCLSVITSVGTEQPGTNHIQKLKEGATNIQRVQKKDRNCLLHFCYGFFLPPVCIGKTLIGTATDWQQFSAKIIARFNPPAWEKMSSAWSAAGSSGLRRSLLNTSGLLKTSSLRKESNQTTGKNDFMFILIYLKKEKDWEKNVHVKVDSKPNEMRWCV